MKHEEERKASQKCSSFANTHKKLKVRPGPQKDMGYAKEWFLRVIT